jgi:FMN-dependent NADH-azoreductase
MPTLLHLDSAVFAADQSASRSVTADFRAAWEKANPDGTVIYRDLAADPVPHITADGWYAGALSPEDRTEQQKADFAIRDVLIDELERADAVVIGAPMYNFGIPSTLKAWFDNVIISGRTGHTDESLAHGTPVTVVTSRGGSYAPGTPMESHEHLINHLDSILSWIMRTEPHFITVDLTLAKSVPGMEELIPLGEKSLAAAREDAAGIASDLVRRLTA